MIIFGIMYQEWVETVWDTFQDMHYSALYFKIKKHARYQNGQKTT